MIINDGDNYMIGQQQVDKVMQGTELIWELVPNYTSVEFTIDGEYIPGVDFPTDIELFICCIGGGGGGGDVDGSTPFGGYSGEVKSTTHTFFSGSDETLILNIGMGGAIAIDGEETSIAYTSGGSAIRAGGGYTADGVGYLGDGESRTTCGGTANDGLKIDDEEELLHGGQSSGAGQGGDGYVGDGGTEMNGSRGSGGGSGGSGGDGIVIITW